MDLCFFSKDEKVKSLHVAGKGTKSANIFRVPEDKTFKLARTNKNAASQPSLQVSKPKKHQNSQHYVTFKVNFPCYPMLLIENCSIKQGKRIGTKIAGETKCCAIEFQKKVITVATVTETNRPFMCFYDSDKISSFNALNTVNTGFKKRPKSVGRNLDLPMSSTSSLPSVKQNKEERESYLQKRLSTLASLSGTVQRRKYEKPISGSKTSMYSNPLLVSRVRCKLRVLYLFRLLAELF